MLSGGPDGFPGRLRRSFKTGHTVCQGREDRGRKAAAHGGDRQAACPDAGPAYMMRRLRSGLGAGAASGAGGGAP